MKKSPLLAALVPVSLCCAALCLVGCGDSDAENTPSETNAAQQEASQPFATPASRDGDGEMVTLTDPNEGAFTVQMPSGWKNDARLLRISDQNRSVGRSVSPDEETSLFFGNPHGPLYLEPTPELPENSPVSGFNPMARIRRYVPAETYFVKHVKEKYGKLPGFHLAGVGDAPQYEQVLKEQMQRQGVSLPRCTTTAVSFTYEAKGKTMHAVIYGSTLGTDKFWMTDVLGVSSSGDPVRYRDMLLRMAGSYRTDPSWKEADKERSARKSEESRIQHQRTMAQIQANTDAMTRGHNQRMRDIHAFGEANTRNFNERMRASDENHRRFIDTIRGEETVAGNGGETYKVESGANRYYVNPDNNTYIGTNSTVEQSELGKIPGVNPDNYQEMHIKP